MRTINFFPKFNDLKFNDLMVDFHLHSTWTDGQNSITEIIKSAKKNNIHSIAITDHIRKTSTYFNDYKNEINHLNSHENINIYIGFEAKINDFVGNIDVKDIVVKEADIAIASVHRFPIGQRLYNASEFKSNIAQEIELELSLAALNMGGFNVLGHPGGMSLTAHNEFHQNFFEEIIVMCSKNDIAFDLNGRYHCNQLNILLPLLKKYNPHVSIGTDSHSVKSIGYWNNILKGYIKCML